MLRLLSEKLWHEIKTAVAGAKQRRAAIAYVTRDLIGLRKGDVLVANAFPGAIRNGETDAHLLLKLYRKGVRIYAHSSLHAKVIVAGDVAVVGSCNMSSASAQLLKEAAVITNAGHAVAQADALIEQLIDQAKLQSESELKALTRIKVQRHGNSFGGKKRRGIHLGRTVWVVGLYEIETFAAEEQKMADETIHEIAADQKIDEDDVSCIRWTGTSGFATDCRPGDQVMQIWREYKQTKEVECVLKPVPVLRRRTLKGVHFIFIRDTKTKVSWAKFRRSMARWGYGRLGMYSASTIPAHVAEKVSHLWRD